MFPSDEEQYAYERHALYGRHRAEVDREIIQIIFKADEKSCTFPMNILDLPGPGIIRRFVTLSPLFKPNNGGKIHAIEHDKKIYKHMLYDMQKLNSGYSYHDQPVLLSCDDFFAALFKSQLIYNFLYYCQTQTLRVQFRDMELGKNLEKIA